MDRDPSWQDMARPRLGTTCRRKWSASIRPKALSPTRRPKSPTSAEFRVGDARALPAGDAEFDVIVLGLVLNFVPDQPKAVAEMRRAARQLMRKFWDAAIALNPKARELDEGLRFPICQPEPLRDLFTSAGLRNVASQAIDVPTVFENLDDYWSPFLSGQGPAPGYCVSLPEADRNALRERVKASFAGGQRWKNPPDCSRVGGAGRGVKRGSRAPAAAGAFPV